MGGGGKGSMPQDNSLELYREQQAALAAEKAEAEAKQQAEADAEKQRRDELRRQMLGNSVSTDEENGAIQQNQLG